MPQKHLFPLRVSALAGMAASSRGFTLTELVAVLVIAAILAVSASSMFNRRTFDTAAFADQTFTQLAYAQKVAVAARRTVTVSVSGNTISLAMCTDAACTSSVPVPSPQGEASFSRTAPAGITVASTNATFAFTALGGLNAGANVTLTVTGDVARNLTVESVTGYVHP
jgi:MSHA pilin protein MshC